MKPGFKPILAARHLRNSDAQMANLVKKVGRCRLEVNSSLSLFQTLLRSIIYQKIATHSAAAIYGRVQSLFGQPTNIQPDELLAIDPQTLKSAGLSQAKLEAVIDLAVKTNDRTVPLLTDAFSMSDEKLIDQIIKVRGIGRWTVEMMLIYRLGRPDVLPVGDWAIRRGYQLAYDKSEMPDAASLSAAGEQWAPYRSVASWYLWRATDSVDW